MSKATTKIELINLANENFNKLLKIINSLSYEEKTAPFCFNKETVGKEAHWQRDNNLRDVLAHLYEWHQLLLTWEQDNASGKNRPFLPSPYTWKTYGEMNIEFWKKHQKTLFNQILENLKESHQKVLTVINKYTDQQLFTKSLYTWTGTSSLGQYCLSATSSHYEWAIKKMKQQIKAMTKKE